MTSLTRNKATLLTLCSVSKLMNVEAMFTRSQTSDLTCQFCRLTFCLTKANSKQWVKYNLL